MPTRIKEELEEVCKLAKSMTGSMRPDDRDAALEGIELLKLGVERLELLARNVRKVYGRNVIRSCGLDDMASHHGEDPSIVILDEEPTDFEPGEPG